MGEKIKNSPAPDIHQGIVHPADIIYQQLQRIFASSQFDGTKTQRAFLKYVVRKTIEGKSDQIKGYTIATEVFGRGGDFDQKSDPIVSIQANKLRRALERYYLTTGKRDPIRIDIPKGSYIPAFIEQTGVAPDRAAGSENNPSPGHEGAWPTLVVRQFKNLTGDPDFDYLAIGLTTELAMEINRCQDVRVLMYGPEGRGRRISDSAARFAIDGTIQKEKSKIKVNVQLIDLKTGFQIWGDTHHSNFRANQIITFQEKVAQEVTAQIAGEFGIITRTLAPESKGKPPAKLKTFEAILRFHEYDRTLTPESFSRALEALSHAANFEPGCGQVWTMLGHLYANIFSLDLPGFEKPLKKAIKFAEKGAHLNPANQRARATLAFVSFFANELGAALREIKKALLLNPNSIFMLDGVGYIMTLLGQWAQGPELIRKVIATNPYYRPAVHYGLWLDWIRREDYERAYLETLPITMPSIFWDPLVKASTLGLLGRHKEGEAFAEVLLEIKPDFPGKGRVLIAHYIKFKEIAERVIEGLNRVGLKVH
jgi:adenylate cyclase